jgi:hypothetical protein
MDKYDVANLFLHKSQRLVTDTDITLGFFVLILFKFQLHKMVAL